MTIHVTWPGLLMVVGGASLLWFLTRVLYGLWIIPRWGK